MTTLTLPDRALTRSVAQPTDRVDEYAPRADRYRHRESSSALPKDRLGRKIAQFVRDHRCIAAEFGSIDLSTLDEPGKSAILDRIRSILKIPTFTRQDLGYVGS